MADVDPTRRVYLQVPPLGRGEGKVHKIAQAGPWVTRHKAMQGHAEVHTACGRVYILGRFGDVDAAVAGPATCKSCLRILERR